MTKGIGRFWTYSTSTQERPSEFGSVLKMVPERPGSIISDKWRTNHSGHHANSPLEGNTKREPQQYYSLELNGSDGTLKPRRISDFPHPHPGLIDPPKEILRYKRADGVELNATLYTSPGYDAKRDGPLPTIMWGVPS